MAINVNTNLGSINAQRNLSLNSSSLSNTLKRLSSGMRINSASDDAAGLAISNGLVSQVRGMNQAIRNANDGISLLATAEGSIVEQTNILQRVRELAVQSSTDTNSGLNRTSLNNEATQLKNELDRIAKTAEFNGIKLLDGTFTAKDLQVGAYATSSDRITLNVGSTRATSIGSAYKATGTTVTANALTAGAVTLTTSSGTYSVGASLADGVSTVTSTTSALSKANAINAISNNTNVTAEAQTDLVGNANQAAGSLVANDLKINGIDIGAVTTTSSTDQALMAAINAKSGDSGVTAAMDGSGKLTLTAVDGRNIQVQLSGDAAATMTGLYATTGAAQNNTARGIVTLRSTEAFSIDGSAEADAGLTAGAASLATTENVGAISLTSKANAQLAIKIVDVAMSQLNGRRGDIGALTNRLSTTVNNLSAAVENASASNSRILDADFASETAMLSRTQILQQAGVAILAQANQSPQLALSLLR